MQCLGWNCHCGNDNKLVQSPNGTCTTEDWQVGAALSPALNGLLLHSHTMGLHELTQAGLTSDIAKRSTQASKLHVNAGRCLW